MNSELEHLARPDSYSVDFSTDGDLFENNDSAGRNLNSQLVSLMSCVYAVLLVVLSFAFQVAVVTSPKGESITEFDPFYIYLYTAGILFFIYFHCILGHHRCSLAFSRVRSTVQSFRRGYKKPPDDELHTSPVSTSVRCDLVTYSAPSAANMYLRLGAIVFGLAAIVTSCLKVIIHIDPSSDCPSVIHVTYDLAAIAFTFAQMYFVFQNSRLTVHRFRAFGRFGMMHLVATNLCVWIRAMVIEENEILTELNEGGEEGGRDTQRNSPQRITTTTTTPTAWNRYKNSDLQSHSCLENSTMFAAIRTVSHFTTTCVVEYSLICAAVMFILWANIGAKDPRRKTSGRRKRNIQIDCGSTAKGLFCGLSCVVMSIVTFIVSFAYSNHERFSIEALWVYYVSDCALYLISILTTVIALQRLSLLTYIHANRSTLLDDMLLWVGLIGQIIFCVFSLVAIGVSTNVLSDRAAALQKFTLVVTSLQMLQSVMQTVMICMAQRLRATTLQLQKQKPARNLITFLLIINLALFVVNTFETQKVQSNPVMRSFYQRGPLAIILHASIPLTIFYRFHSSVCLCEIWKNSYKYKATEPNE